MTRNEHVFLREKKIFEMLKKKNQTVGIAGFTVSKIRIESAPCKKATRPGSEPSPTVPQFNRRSDSAVRTDGYNFSKHLYTHPKDKKKKNPYPRTQIKEKSEEIKQKDI